MLGESESSNLITTDFPRSLYSGLLDKGGEMKISEPDDFRLTNSSNVIRISFSSNLVEKFRGMHSVTSGGAISFGPPVGVTGLAQRNNRNEKRESKRMI